MSGARPGPWERFAARHLNPERRIALYPPFWLMRIRVLERSEDWGRIRIRLPLGRLVRNGAGCMFGGVQACLADPIPALACLHRYPGYRIAAKRLEFDFVRVGNSDLILHFDFPKDLHETILRALAENGRADPRFEMVYTRADGLVCTRIANTVAIRPRGYVSSLETAAPAGKTETKTTSNTEETS